MWNQFQARLCHRSSRSSAAQFPGFEPIWPGVGSAINTRLLKRPQTPFCYSLQDRGKPIRFVPTHWLVVSVLDDFEKVTLLSLASSCRDDRTKGLGMCSLFANHLSDIFFGDLEFDHTGVGSCHFGHFDLIGAVHERFHHQLNKFSHRILLLLLGKVSGKTSSPIVETGLETAKKPYGLSDGFGFLRKVSKR